MEEMKFDSFVERITWDIYYRDFVWFAGTDLRLQLQETVEHHPRVQIGDHLSIPLCQQVERDFSIG
jgi:hypothetical protein